MSLSVEELDQTVKQFYEGRGEVVWPGAACYPRAFEHLKLTAATAKASAEHFEPGIISPSLSDVIIADESVPVQRKSGGLAVGGQDTARGFLPADQVSASPKYRSRRAVLTCFRYRFTSAG